MNQSALSILQQYWQYDSFRFPQSEIIERVVSQQDVIALLPTGSGKSICFQVPALMYDSGVTLVISPLIALMKDQISSLKAKEIEAEMISGFVTDYELVRIFDNITFGKTRFLYIAPERLQSELFLEKIKNAPVNLIAIDEAHCISEWGHDFRPSYVKINVLRELFPQISMIALTATATPEVVKDIEKYLNLFRPKIFNTPLTRNNLVYKVINTGDKMEKLLQSVNHKDCTIIYAGTRKNVEQTSNYLNHKGFKSVFYHAGLTDTEKESAYHLWKKNKTNIMVATNAFGMGIDKPDVRKVIHINIPNSIENYIQESGRAGRDGKKSEAIIIENVHDISRYSDIYSVNLPDADFIKKTYYSLNQYFKITYGEHPEKEFPFSLTDFAKIYNLSTAKVFNTLELFENEGLITLSHHKEEQYWLHCSSDTEQLFHYYQNKNTKEQIIKYLLRTYDGILEHSTLIFPDIIADHLNLTKQVLIKNILDMEKDNMIEFQYFTKTNGIKFLVPREDQYTLSSLIYNNKKRIENKTSKYQKMLTYVTQHTMCRNVYLTEYFGFSQSTSCKMCDVCTNEIPEKFDEQSIQNQILEILSQEPISVKKLVNLLHTNEKEILIVIRKMLKNELIQMNNLQQIQKI